jgi:hypothetical protein
LPLREAQQQEEAPLTAARVVGTKRIAPHRLVEESTKACLQVRIPLLPYPSSNPSQYSLFSENLPAQQDFPESHYNVRIRGDDNNTAVRAGEDLNALNEMIVHSDYSDDDPATEAEDTAEAETAGQSPN